MSKRKKLEGLIPNLRKIEDKISGERPGQKEKEQEVGENKRTGEKTQGKTKRAKPQKMIGINFPKKLYDDFVNYAFSIEETSLSKVFRGFLKTLFEDKKIFEEFSEFMKGYIEERPFKDYKMAMLVLDDETEKIFNNYVIALRVRPKSKLARALVDFMIKRGEK